MNNLLIALFIYYYTNSIFDYIIDFIQHNYIILILKNKKAILNY